MVCNPSSPPPPPQVRDAGNLLTRADLRLPSVDVDAFHIGYPSPLELVQHLRVRESVPAAPRAECRGWL